MYKINVVLRNPFFTMTDGRRNVTIFIEPGGTLRDLIKNLLRNYAQFSTYIPMEVDDPEEYIIAIREGVILNFSTPLADGDTVQLLPPISGG